MIWSSGPPLESILPTLPTRIDPTKVAVVHGFPPDVTASDIHTYFATFGSVTNVDFSKTTKVARVVFSETTYVDAIVTMGKTNSLTMDGAMLKIEWANGVDHEKWSQQKKRERTQPPRVR